MVDAAVWFGMGATVFLVAIVTFVGFAVTRGDLGSPYYFIPPIHATIAGTAYVLMALVALGVIPTVINELFTVSIFRYADWTFSTPIITYYLAMLAGTDLRTRVVAVLANVLMILTGLGSVVAAEFVGVVAQGALFAVSSLFFLGLLYLYLRTFGRAIEDNPRSSRSLFVSLRDLTVGIWSLYPIVYLLGPHGAGILQVADHHFVIVVLDLTAKVGFMTVMLVRQYELNTFTASETTASPN